jgi:ubiquinone/menaquinone biosynthesis C-methylase UbiE
MGQERYVIEGGQKGRERLSVLSRALQPTTLQLFGRAGVMPGMHVLDVGCGGGDVTLDLARLVGAEGKVRGLDFDAEILRLARQEAEEAQLHHVEFQVADARNLQIEALFDVVYARFLLTHLPDPAQGLMGMIRAAKPGGKVIVEEIDFSGRFCYPPNAAFQRYLDLYTQVAQHRGGDAYIGMRLASLFFAAGLEEVQVNLIQPVHLTGEGKAIAQITMARIASAVVTAGFATQEEVDQTVAEIAAFAARPDTLMSYPRIFQVWGVRSQEK